MIKMPPKDFKQTKAYKALYDIIYKRMLEHMQNNLKTPDFELGNKIRTLLRESKRV